MIWLLKKKRNDQHVKNETRETTVESDTETLTCEHHRGNKMIERLIILFVNAEPICSRPRLSVT